MASISKHQNGRKTIQFIGADGRRRSIRLGKVSQRYAEAVKVKVEQLVTASITGHSPDDETSRWVASLDNALREKLARANLIQDFGSVTLGDFIEEYLRLRVDLRPSTHQKLATTQRYLVQYYDNIRDMRSITAGDADSFRLHLVGRGLAENSIRKHISIAKQFFQAAVRKQLIPANPFADLKSTVQPNTSRFYFVTREEAQKVLDACPDAQWRLLFALSRFGGLRCPSEHLSLRWQDVDWEQQRITVRSPKTEHHVGRESRVIPMFPELQPYLEEVWEEAEPGTEFVISRYRDTNVNLRTHLLRIIGRAGVQPWPKLFQNLRSTRETELAEEYPLHVVCAWIGNSQTIAAKHYLQVTDEHFGRAIRQEETAGALHFPVQQTAASSGNGSQQENSRESKSPVLLDLASSCDYLP